MSIRIPLHGQGGVVVGHALIDSEDMDLVGARRWHLHPSGYAQARSGIGHGRILMHRLILGLVPGDGLITDHINRDKLDNRRSNLRVGDKSLNAQNRDRPPGRSSQYRGVTRQGKKWRAMATIRQKQHLIGLFDREEDAARAASEFRAENMPWSQDAQRRAA